MQCSEIGEIVEIGNNMTNDRFIRQVFIAIALCAARTVHNRTAQRAPEMINLMLPHKQMQYRKSSFLNNFKRKTITKVIDKNMPPGHHNHKICFNKIKFR